MGCSSRGTPDPQAERALGERGLSDSPFHFSFHLSLNIPFAVPPATFQVNDRC